MNENAQTLPKMLTIREVARTGIMPEHALRSLAKEGRLPAITVGKCGKTLINLPRLIEQLESL